MPADTTTTMPARDGVLDGLHERIGRRRLENRMAERQIDDVDVERVLVGDRELDGANHVVGRALALRVENLQANQARSGATPT